MDARAPVVEAGLASAARPASRASSASRARRYRSIGASAPRPARDRRSSGSWVSATKAREASSALLQRRRPAIRPGRHVGKALRRREGGARIDDRHVVAEPARHRRQRLQICTAPITTSRAAARGRSRKYAALPRLDGARSCRCGTPRRARPRADRRRYSAPRTSRCAPLSRSVTTTTARRAARSAFSACEERRASSAQSSFSTKTRMRAAAGQADAPGGLVGDAEFQHLGLAALDHVERLGHHRALDAAARHRALEIALAVDRRDGCRPAAAPSPRSRPRWRWPHRARPSRHVSAVFRGSPSCRLRHRDLLLSSACR